MSKDAAEGAELYYAQTSITKKVDLNRICSRISKYSTASRGDILLVVKGKRGYFTRIETGITI